MNRCKQGRTARYGSRRRRSPEADWNKAESRAQAPLRLQKLYAHVHFQPTPMLFFPPRPSQLTQWFGSDGHRKEYNCRQPTANLINCLTFLLFTKLYCVIHQTLRWRMQIDWQEATHQKVMCSSKKKKKSLQNSAALWPRISSLVHKGSFLIFTKL